MLTRLDLRGVRGPLRSALPRPEPVSAGPVEAVRAILAEVRAGGDEAVRACTNRFDRVDVPVTRVSAAELEGALARIPDPLREALTAARDAIDAFHRGQVIPAHRFERSGVEVRSLSVPVDRGGLYVPGGRAVYPSTVLMTAVPARVAGVERLVLCAPPDRSGDLPDATLAAAALAGVDEVHRIGGAQAIAAMAYGTETIDPVDVIVGPGNVYVALAKREVAGQGLVGVPSSFTGPSEVVVVADGSAPPAYAAIDVILQAEHGPDGLAWLVTWDPAVADAIESEIVRLVARSPRRDDIVATFARSGWSVVVDGPEAAIEVANAIAPEHLELIVADPEPLVALVRHAGAVFCGPWSPASVGDYVAGPSHVLPVYGSARFGQALTVTDFLKQVHVITASEAGLRTVAPHVLAIAEAEGLAAHAESVRLRVGP